MCRWNIIEGHPNWEISNVGGLIRNVETKEIKSTYIQMKGYPMVSLDGDAYLVHRLVAAHFVPNPDNKPCVDHIDGNKLNADASNLRWVTYHENNSNPNTSWKNAHHGEEPWNKGLTNPYDEDTLAKMRVGSIKGGETMRQKAIERRQYPDWEKQEKAKRAQYAKKYYSTHRDEISARNKERYRKRKSLTYTDNTVRSSM